MNADAEPAWQRDRRLREDAERMVRIEEHGKATYELLLEERAVRREAEKGLQRHMTEDDERFKSIDSRLQSVQGQLSASADTLRRIEVKVDAGAARLKELEDADADRTAVARFLSSTWLHVVGGGTIVGAAVAAYELVVA